MSETANLELPVLEAGQAQKHVTVNEALGRLDAVVQLSAVSATIAAQPGAPAEGAVYLLPAGKSGAAWAAMAEGALAHFRGGAWEEITPREGWIAYLRDSDSVVFYTGAAWAGLPATKLLSVSASDMVLGRVSASGGAAEEIPFTDQAQQLCDDGSFGAMRTTLGLGSGDSPQFTAINLGHASDTTITRLGAGIVAIEGAQALVLTTPLKLSSQTSVASPTTNNAGVQINGTSEATDWLSQAQFSADANGPIHWFLKSRGASVGAFGSAVANDVLGSLNFGGSDSSTFFWTGGAIQFLAKATFDGTTSETQCKVRIVPNASTTVTDALIVDGLRTQVALGVLNIKSAKTPASASAVGMQGDICWDASFLYVCIATNTWKRVAIATW